MVFLRNLAFFLMVKKCNYGTKKNTFETIKKAGSRPGRVKGRMRMEIKNRACPICKYLV